jgi:hypothetical protein
LEQKFNLLCEQKIIDIPGIFCILILDIHTLNLKQGGVMRLVKALALMGVILFCLGAFFLFMEGKADPVDQPQFGKPAMWGDDVLVHTGWVSRNLRNGYSSDYDDDNDILWVAVAGYSSGKDSCWLYYSTNGGENWNLRGYIYSDVVNADLSNPQVVVGEGANSYVFWFVLDNNWTSTLWRLYGLTEEINISSQMESKVFPPPGMTQQAITTICI